VASSTIGMERAIRISSLKMDQRYDGDGGF
jgi:hypothetical protein